MLLVAEKNLVVVPSLEGLGVPGVHAPVDVASKHALAVRVETDPLHTLGVDHVEAQGVFVGVLRGEIPQLDRAVTAARGDPVVVRREGRRVDRVAVSAQRQRFSVEPVLGHLPQARVAIGTA